MNVFFLEGVEIFDSYFGCRFFYLVLVLNIVGENDF